VEEIKMSKCPICSSESYKWDDVEEEGKKRNFELFKCKRCGHGFFYPGVKNKEELFSYYNEEYAKTYTPEVDAESFKLRKKQYVADVELLLKYLNFKKSDNVTVLDIGCSTGQFLNNMPNSWEKFGFEVNKTEIKYIKKNYSDIDVRDDFKLLEDEKYDIITLRGVIEHLFDFEELMEFISKVLKVGGIVYLCATPDFSSPCAHVYLSKWNQISAPIHYHQFTNSSLTILFGKFGLGLKVLAHPYLSTPYNNVENDSKKFFENIKKMQKNIENENYNDFDGGHAYPGTMMSMIFENIGK
jgi:SAM-dependent methyltransferase